MGPHLREDDGEGDKLKEWRSTTGVCDLSFWLKMKLQ
jgi:hypothetical protein